jgi:hypothetical protein
MPPTSSFRFLATLLVIVPTSLVFAQGQDEWKPFVSSFVAVDPHAGQIALLVTEDAGFPVGEAQVSFILDCQAGEVLVDGPDAVIAAIGRRVAVRDRVIYGPSGALRCVSNVPAFQANPEYPSTAIANPYALTGIEFPMMLVHFDVNDAQFFFTDEFDGVPFRAIKLQVDNYRRFDPDPISMSLRDYTPFMDSLLGIPFPFQTAVAGMVHGETIYPYAYGGQITEEELPNETMQWYSYDVFYDPDYTDVESGIRMNLTNEWTEGGRLLVTTVFFHPLRPGDLPR